MANTNAKLVGPIFAIIGALFAGVGYWMAFDAVKFDQRAYEVTGEVVSIKELHSTDSDGRDSVTYKPTILYKSIDGRSYEAETHMSSSEYDYAVGAIVDIKYDPANPDEVRINSLISLYIFPAIFSILGTGFCVGGLMFWSADRRKSRPAQSNATPSNRTVRRD